MNSYKTGQTREITVFQILDNRQRRAVITEKKETNLVSSTITLAFYVGTISRVQCREGEPKYNSSGLAEWGRQRPELKATELASFCGLSHKEGRFAEKVLH